MKTKTLSAAAALGVAAALSGAPAAMADGDPPRITPPDIAFPADTIEHRVLKHCETVTGIYTRFGRNGCIIVDQYIANDRDHEIWRDEPTGKLLGENATTNGTIFSWTAKSNTLNVGKSKRGNKPSNITLEADGAFNRESVNRGWYRVDREEVRDGRPGVVLVETSASPADNATTEVFVDPTTYATLERRTHAVAPPNARSNGGELTAQDTLVAVEQLPRTTQTEKVLQFGDHSGATVREVIGEDELVASAAKKLGLKAKLRAKIAKKAKASTRKGR